MTALAKFYLVAGEHLPAEKAIERCEQLATASTVDRTFWLALGLQIAKENL